MMNSTKQAGPETTDITPSFGNSLGNTSLVTPGAPTLDSVEETEADYTSSGFGPLIYQHLSEQGIRYTRARRTVVENLREAAGPLTVSELFDRLDQQVPMSSIYRSLSVLELAGVVEPHFGQDRVTRYELAQWISGRHYHLVCSCCGAMSDLEPDPKEVSQLEKVIRHISERVAVEPEGHLLEILYHCHTCR